jgi:wyosine [tRNA(Phe)-imidazoG37] synthetase (radical SAM superfamily)
MAILFDKIVFGPVHSRRFNTSLGINLLPRNFKYCSFNCIYCECGWTYSEKQHLDTFYSAEEVKEALEIKLSEMARKSEHLDAITFAGNGEPTLHPEFPQITQDTLLLRDKYFKSVKVIVLSNSTTLNNPAIVQALSSVDGAVLKLDAGSEEMFRLINQPLMNINLHDIVEELKKFKHNLTIQSLFLKGMINGINVDNTTDKEINLWLENLKQIMPQKVMIYPIDRETPAKNIIKIPKNILNEIGEKVKKLNIDVSIY